MAKYFVTHSCGHRVEHALFGPDGGRHERIEWLKTVPCQECKREAERAAVAERAAREQLPALVGSDKQVAWAMTIRDRVLAEIDRTVEQRAAGFRRRSAHLSESEPERYAAVLAAMDESLAAARARLAAETAARWWIDNRETSALALFNAHYVPLATAARYA